jgi:streptomycin 6-kinase
MACNMTALAIPDEVVRMNVAVHGEAGRGWIAALPGLVEELSARWRLTIGPPFEGGCVGFVAPALAADGEPAVLKISLLDEENRQEGEALGFWDGDGAVRLLDADPDLGALLLERLEPGSPLEDHPNRDEAITIACSLLRHLWRPVPDPSPFASARDLVLRWSQELPERFDRLGRPFEASLISHAVAVCEALGRSAEHPILANRDFHLGNILAAHREPWLLIDPKPLIGERAVDTGHLLRTLLPENLEVGTGVRLIDRLAVQLDLDPRRIQAWAFVRSVDDVLWGLEIEGSDVRWDLACARLLARGL